LAELACDSGNSAVPRRKDRASSTFRNAHEDAPSRELTVRAQHGFAGTIVVIRFVRRHADHDAAPAGLDQLASRGQLDLLQLDYVRPRLAPVTGPAPAELPEIAGSFIDAVRSLGKTLFLEPELRVVASAGWSNSYLLAERAGQALAEAGCPETPVSAVRGSNVLAILEDLVAGGLKLPNLETGAAWTTLRAPILAADLQLGAGPLAAALGEGARIVVAGHYDAAAPAIAAAIAAGAWSWKELDHLAAAAAAAHAAVWPSRHAALWNATGAPTACSGEPRIELAEDSSFTVDLSNPCGEPDACGLLAWLQASPSSGAAHEHADVRYDASRAAVSATGPTQLRVTGITGAANPHGWRLDILYQSGYLAETMVQFLPGAAVVLRRQMADAFRTRFVDAVDEHLYVTVQELAPPDAAAANASWLHLACRSPRSQPCHEFAEAIASFAAANPTIARLPAGRPTVHAECRLWPTRIPRDAVDVAIDTRPAKEWQ
jgi:hypothetical protein